MIFVNIPFIIKEKIMLIVISLSNKSEVIKIIIKKDTDHFSFLGELYDEQGELQSTGQIQNLINENYSDDKNISQILDLWNRFHLVSLRGTDRMLEKLRLGSKKTTNIFIR